MTTSLQFGSTSITDMYHLQGVNLAGADIMQVAYPLTQGRVIVPYGKEQSDRTARSFTFAPANQTQDCLIYKTTTSAINSLLTTLENYMKSPNQMIQTLTFYRGAYTDMRMHFIPIGEQFKMTIGSTTYYAQRFAATFVRY